MQHKKVEKFVCWKGKGEGSFSRYSFTGSPEKVRYGFKMIRGPKSSEILGKSKNNWKFAKKVEFPADMMIKLIAK